MNRRTASTMVASLLFAGCGGGGSSGGGEAAVPVVTAGTAPAPVPSFAATPDIAVWGDSMLPGVARAFMYIFERPRQIFEGGIAGETSVQVAARMLADTDHRNWVSIFWFGHNNLTQPAQIKADMASSVAHLAPGNNRFIVLSLVNRGDGENGRGTPGYEAIIRLNNDLAATYGQNYLDIRAFMVSQFDPNNPQQVAEFQADVPSSSLRFDAVHLTGFGSEVVARRLKTFIESKGW